MSEPPQYPSFLFSKLKWPSGMVRERACVEIAELLLNSIQSRKIQEHLLRWIGDQQLETFAAIGLLVILQTKIENESFKCPPVEQIVAAVKKPSLLSSMLIQEMTSQHLPPNDWPSLNSGTAPSDFKVDGFFHKHSRAFLPPIYMDVAEDIDERCPFIRQWGFEWHQLLDRLGRTPSLKNVDFFFGRPNHERHVAIDFELSEIYRSAYLRALTWTVMVNVISPEGARLLTLKTCPIDLGLWRLRPARKPKWWPQPNPPEGQIDTIPAQIWEAVDAFCNKQTFETEEWFLAEARGRVFDGKEIYDLDIFGLFQQCNGPDIPDLEKLSIWYQNLNTADYTPSSLKFEGTINPVSADVLAKTFGDWIVVPMANHLSPATTPRWQFWRIYRGVWVPATCLGSNEFSFSCSADALKIYQGGHLIGTWHDWTENLREQLVDNISPSTGQYLFVHRALINDFARNTNSTPCWLCRITGYHRDYDYQPYKTFTDYRCFGATRIALA